jgi:predicted dehydrogenase
MGAIGVGSKGSRNVVGFMSQKGVQMVAICDVDDAQMRHTRQLAAGRFRSFEADQYRDFRQLLERPDIDAVSIATPDHWHVLTGIAAVRAGKDVFCEKPLSYSIAEGRAAADAVAMSDRIWQTGSQQRSQGNFRLACELVRNGRIGRVHTVRVTLPRGPEKGPPPAGEPIPVPEGFDYDTWLGPAPKAAYHPKRCHGNFRWVRDYSGGIITDWAGHHCDIAQWGMGTDLTGPVEIEGAGRTVTEGLWDTIYQYRFECRYAEGFTMIVTDTGPKQDRGGRRVGVIFEGTGGMVHVYRGGIEARPRSLLKSTMGPNEIHLYKSDNHKGNFLDCVKSRRQTAAPAETAHRSISIGHLGLIAMKLGRKLGWDPAAERFVNDAEADRLLGRPMRSPWRI